MEEGSIDIDRAIVDIEAVCQCIDTGATLYKTQIAVQALFRHQFNESAFHDVTGDLSFLERYNSEEEEFDEEVFARGHNPLGAKLEGIQRALWIHAFHITEGHYGQELSGSSTEREVILKDTNLEEIMDEQVGQCSDHPWSSETEREKHRKDVVRMVRDRIDHLQEHLEDPKKIDVLRREALQRDIEGLHIYLRILQGRIATHGEVTSLENELLKGRSVHISYPDEEERRKIMAEMEEVTGIPFASLEQ